MSRTKIASHYYNLGRQQAARDILGGRTKTAAPLVGPPNILAMENLLNVAKGSAQKKELIKSLNSGRISPEQFNISQRNLLEDLYEKSLARSKTLEDGIMGAGLPAMLQEALIQGNIKGSQGLDAIVSALNTAGSKLRGIDPQQFRSEFMGASRLPRGAVESFEQGFSDVPAFYANLMGKGEGRKALESFLAN